MHCLLCQNPRVARGLCKKHYYFHRRRGSLLQFTKTRPDVKTRLLFRIEKTKSGCWEWLGPRHWLGYASIWVEGKNQPVHRVSYQTFKGPIPKGLYVCHTCDNPPCINPKHLFLGTHIDNIKDAVSKGRHARGEKNGHAVFTEKEILKIRASSENCSALARKYEVNPTTIQKIKKRISWRHI